MYYYNLFDYLEDEELQYYRNHFGNFTSDNLKIDDFFGQCCYYNNWGDAKYKGKCRPKKVRVYFEYINVITHGKQESISDNQKWFITGENKIYNFNFPEYFLAVNRDNTNELELHPNMSVSGEWTKAKYTNFEVIYYI